MVLEMTNNTNPKSSVLNVGSIDFNLGSTREKNTFKKIIIVCRVIIFLQFWVFLVSYHFFQILEYYSAGDNYFLIHFDN